MKKYTIRMNGLTDDERHDFDELPLAEAKTEIKRLKEKFPNRKFYLLTGGNSGMGCFFNPDGNHAIDGQPW